MKGVDFWGLGNGARSVNVGRVDLRLWKVITVGFTAFLLSSVFGAAGVVVALPVDSSPMLREVDASRVVVTLGTMTMEVIEYPDRVMVAYTQAGVTHHVVVIDDSEGYRYSVDGGSWRRAPLDLGRTEDTSWADYSSADPRPDPDSHFNRRYWWDGVWFMRGYPAAYPHPDRGYYHVVAKSDWRYWGIQLVHSQFGTDIVGSIVSLGPAAVGLLIGAAVGGMIGGAFGAAIGALIGAIVGGILSYYYHIVFVDEAGSIWWWINRDLFTAIRNIPWWLWFCGRCIDGYIAAHIDYLRIGTLTANNDLGIRGP